MGDPTTLTEAEREALTRAIAAYVCNVSNLPEPLQIPALGLHMGDLIDGMVEAVAPVLAARSSTATGVTAGDDLRDGWEVEACHCEGDDVGHFHGPAGDDLRDRVAEFDRIAEWSLHRASAVTKRWLEPAIEQVHAVLAASSAPVVSRPEATVKAEAWNEGVRQAITWLRADYECGTGPEWRENGAEWIAEHLAEHNRARAASLAADPTP